MIGSSSITFRKYLLANKIFMFSRNASFKLLRDNNFVRNIA